MIEASPDSINAIITERDAQIAASFDYVASVLDVAAPRNSKGPLASAIFADVVSKLNQGNQTTAKDLFCGIDAICEATSQTCFGWRSDVLPDRVWDQVHRLFDTDRAIPFLPESTSDAKIDRFKSTLAQAKECLQEYCPAALAEFDQIVSLIFLAEPENVPNGFSFDGASTFFCPEAILINADADRNVAEITEVVLHEASHLLLFALVGSDGLCANDPSEAYTSPLRDEPRPIEGIFHAAFVTSRVHWVMVQLLSGPNFPQDLRAAFENERQRLATASAASMGVLKEHCKPTPKGQEVFDALTAYWA